MKTESKHSPLPLSTRPVFDGRHHYIPIMAAHEGNEDGPYHPLVATVLCGRGHMTKPQAIEFAAHIVKCVNAHPLLVEALRGMFWVHDDNTGLSGAEQSEILRSARALLASLQS